MQRHLAPIAALLISVSVLLTGQGLQGTLLPVRATLEAFPTLWIGVMGAAYFLGFTIGCLRGGELIRGVGHVRVFLAMTAVASALPLVHSLAVEEWVWAILRLATGFCFAVIYVVIESWLNERSTNDNRGFVFSTYALINLSVLAIGQMMTLLYEPTGFQLFAIASVLVSLAAIPVALSNSPSPDLPEAVSVDLRRLFRISLTGSLGCLATGLANGAFWALAPAFTQYVSGDVRMAAWFMTAAVVGGAIAQWPLGIASDRIGRRPVIVFITLVGAAVSAVLVFAVPNASPITLNLLGAAWGMLAFPLYSIAVACANDFTEPAEYVQVSGGLLLLYGVGATVGPFFASAMMTATGAGGLFLYAAVAHLGLAVLAVVRSFLRRAVPAGEQLPFSTALAVAQTASHVYEDEVAQQELGSEQHTTGTDS